MKRPHLEHPYVGRGGVKLAHALDHFHIDVAGAVCLDAGASTGGFTDCLLKRGAARVYAVDVGRGQLAWKLRQDPRVIVRERTNVRYLTARDLPELADCVTLDLAFISLTKVFGAVDQICKPAGVIVALIKPQFEVGKGKVGRGGIVRDPALHQEVIAAVEAGAKLQGWQCRGVIPSPITGADGNVEFLACFVKDH
ncbi:MAG: TlyA family RNA methyltransferase [Deltaproteobacteria bacterium]|nr:TlyA family RNA methyltransferase [Deltaproteobacteria bacterium]